MFIGLCIVAVPTPTHYCGPILLIQLKSISCFKDTSANDVCNSIEVGNIHICMYACMQAWGFAAETCFAIGGRELRRRL